MTKKGNMLMAANWKSDVGYAWWLMESFWIAIAKHLECQNINSILIYPVINSIPEPILQTRIVTREHNFLDCSIDSLLKLRTLIKQNNIKYLYLTDYPNYGWIFLILRLWGIKTIIIHDHTPGERTPPHFIKKTAKMIIQRLPYYTADKFIAVTDYVLNRLVNINCIPASKCSCVPNGIVPIETTSSDLRYTQNEFKIDSNKIIIITTGRATYYKNIDFFIECANHLINLDGNKRYHFLYCGDGPNIGDFRSLVEKYKLIKNFTFAGRRSDVRRILPSCHIGLHVSTGEVGYSLSILEYMSAGLLTIVPNNPSVCLATQHNTTGLLYEENNINSCIAQINSFTGNKRTQLIRNNAKKRVLEKYSLNLTHTKLIENFNL